MAEELTPERHIEIQTLLQELSDYWHDHSELRLGQIACGFSVFASDSPFHTPDAFYIEALAAENKLTAFGAEFKAGK